MQQIIYFFQRFKFFLFFLFLQIIAIILTFNNFNFHKSKFVNSANLITGSFYSKATNISDYFNLEAENNVLIEENIRLKRLLEKNNSLFIKDDSLHLDTLNQLVKYTYINAKIIKNDYSKAFNYLAITKGKNQGLSKEMAVINGKGIIGITDYSTNNYTRVQSILNRNSKINARLKNSNYFGSLEWNGKNYNIVQLTDIPRQALLKVGDTIETGGKSTIFPEGILIGTIVKINKKNTANNKIDVKLFNDMSNLSYVYIINNLHKKEIQSLEIADEN